MTSNSQPAAQRCPCPQPEHLGELVHSQGWSEEMPLLDHMDICCNWLKKIVWDFPWELRWNWVFNRSMENPAPQTCGLFQQLECNNQCAALLDLFPPGPKQDSLTGLLLKASIRYSLGDLVLQLTQRESVSDSDVMDAIKFATHLQNETVFLKLVRDFPRSSTVFKQQFAQQYWNTLKLEKKEGKVEWIYETLYQGGQKDLALYVAVTTKSTHLIVEFCFDETGQCDSTQKKDILRKLYMTANFDDRPYYELVEKYFEQSHDSDTPVLSVLFRKAITASVDFDCVDSFVGLHMLRDEFGGHFMTESVEDDVQFAYNLSAQKRPHFISAVCERMADFQWPDLENESEMLFDIVVKQKLWHVLPAVLSYIKDVEPDASFEGRFKSKKRDSEAFFKLLKMLIHKMLSDRSTWRYLMPALDKLIKERSVLCVKWETYRVKQILKEIGQPIMVSRLIRWCEASRHAYLTLFLAVVTENWDLVEGVVVSSFITQGLDPTTFWTVLEMTIDKQSLSASVALLRSSPITAELLDSKQHLRFCVNACHRHGMTCLAEECDSQGLHDWAAVLRLDAFNDTYGIDIFERCQSSAAANFILRKLFSDCLYNKRFDVARILIPRSTDPEVFKIVLKTAVLSGQCDIVATLIGRVDPSACVENGNKTLLFLAVSSNCSDETKLKMVRLCVAAGLSTFQRGRMMDFVNCPLFRALTLCHDDIAQLLIDSEAYSRQSLKKTKALMLLAQLISMDDKECASYNEVCRAAATPFRLEHMARMVVSHGIGCQPGRAERIKSLGIGQGQIDILNFEDVFLSEKERKEKVRCSLDGE